MMVQSLALTFWTLLLLLGTTCTFVEAQTNTSTVSSLTEEEGDITNASSVVTNVSASSGSSLTDETFRVALDLYKTDESRAVATYGVMETWDVSRVTNFSSLELPATFQKDLSAWNVSSATDMSEVRQEKKCARLLFWGACFIDGWMDAHISSVYACANRCFSK